MKKFFKMYMTFTTSTVQRMLSYKVNFFIFVFGNILKTLVIFYLWKAVFDNSKQTIMNGFNISEMIVYIFISTMIGGAMSTGTVQTVGMEVKDGSIAMNLIKPINYRMRLLFEAIGEFAYGTICVTIPLWIILIATRYFTAGELPPDIKTIVAFILSTILGFLILFLFNFCFGLIAFYVTNVWGVSHLKDAFINFFSGQLIPLAFFPVWLQSFLNFVPFGSLNYTPVMIYLNKITGIALLQALGIQLLWLIIMFVLSSILWNKAINKLTILGG